MNIWSHVKQFFPTFRIFYLCWSGELGLFYFVCPASHSPGRFNCQLRKSWGEVFFPKLGLWREISHIKPSALLGSPGKEKNNPPFLFPSVYL